MSEGPIAVEYVEIRPAPDSKAEFKRGVDDTVAPAAKSATERISQAVAAGLKTPSGAAGAGAALGTVVGQGLAAGVRKAFSAATAVIRTGLAEVKDYQAGLAQLEAEIKSTGGGAGLTARQMESLASAVQAYSGQTDDSIVKSESFLLTFSRLKDQVGAGNDVFTRATKATADLAARLGGDAADKAIILGKALNDPVAGLTGLARAGVQFDDQQKKTIKGLVATGDVLAAQKIILTEVEKQVGGSARAYGETLPGQVDRAHRAFEDLSQELLASSAPALDVAARGAGKLFEVLGSAGPVVPGVLAVAGGLIAATKAVKVFTEVRTVLFAGTAKQVAANEAVARSYDDVAAAATRAAGAETAAGGGAGAAGAGAVAGRAAATGGLIATVGAATIGVVAAGVAVAVKEILDRRGLDKSIQQQVQEALDQGPQAARDQAKDFGVTPTNQPGQYIIDPHMDADKTAAGVDLLNRSARRNEPIDTSRLVDLRLEATGKALAAARAELNDPTKRAAEASSLGGVFGGPFAETAARTKGSADQIAAAREAQRKADQNVAEARRAVAKAQEGGAGAKASQIASAEASVASAQAALRKRGGDDRTEQARLEAAEARLSDLREKGGVNTDKLRAAEDRLKEARHEAGRAADETKQNEASTALGVQDITSRLGGQLKNAKGLRDDARTLIKNGVSRGVLEELDKLEQTAPGTLDRVAKSLTPAMAKQLNKQYADLQKVQQEFLVAPLRAAAEAAKAEQEKILAAAAADQAAAYQRALKANLFGGLGGPAPTAPTAQPTSLAGFGATQAGTPAVTVQLTGVKAATVHTIATSAIDQADRDSGAMIASLS